MTSQIKSNSYFTSLGLFKLRLPQCLLTQCQRLMRGTHKRSAFTAYHLRAIMQKLFKIFYVVVPINPFYIRLFIILLKVLTFLILIPITEKTFPA